MYTSKTPKADIAKTHKLSIPRLRGKRKQFNNLTGRKDFDKWQSLTVIQQKLREFQRENSNIHRTQEYVRRGQMSPGFLIS